MSHRLQVLITQGLEARISKAAHRTRVSKGEWVRRAIHRSLDEPQLVANPVARLEALLAPTADIQQMLAEIDAGRG